VIQTGATVQKSHQYLSGRPCDAMPGTDFRARQAGRRLESKIGDPLPRDTMRSLYQDLPVWNQDWPRSPVRGDIQACERCKMCVSNWLRETDTR
jgi:hypothetical protein